MTLAPSRHLGTRLQLTSYNAEYELPDRCEVPGCYERGEEGGHHIEPRSRTAGPKAWVEVDTFPVRNVCKLCSRHHKMVTGGIGGHMARIIWDGGWAWEERNELGGWSLRGPIG